VTGQQFVINAGDAPTWPRFRIDGPIVNPQVLSQTTGQLVALNYNLGAGEWLSVYPESGRVLLNDTAERYSAYDFAQSSWFQLAPGSNDIRLLASSFSSPAQLTVFHRSAWE
jgi:acyl carrier protein phosphodiesterase